MANQFRNYILTINNHSQTDEEFFVVKGTVVLTRKALAICGLFPAYRFRWRTDR